MVPGFPQGQDRGWIQVKNHRLRRTQTAHALWNGGCDNSFRRQYKTELEGRLIILKNGLGKTCYYAGNCWFSASRRTTDENLSRFFRKQISSSILVFHEYCWCVHLFSIGLFAQSFEFEMERKWKCFICKWPDMKHKSSRMVSSMFRNYPLATGIFYYKKIAWGFLDISQF